MDAAYKTIEQINRALMDEESKRIFMNRLLFSFTSDYEYIKKMCEGSLFSKERTYILWGRGYWGNEIFTCYPGVNWIGVCDNKPAEREKNFHGLRSINIAELKDKYSDSIIVIATKNYWREIQEQLKNIGISDDRMINLGKIQEKLSQRVYFDLDYLPKKENEVFIDGGCFDVATSKSFIRWCNGNYKKIYAFEPDRINADQCKKIVEEEHIENIEIYNCALSNKNEKLTFEQNGTEMSGKVEFGNTVVEGKRLEDIVEEKISFIKLDIEGMELDALKGMKKIIINDAPKIAVSVYHKKEDILNIAEYLLKLRPTYKFYLRHYSIGVIDTVLYAIDID